MSKYQAKRNGIAVKMSKDHGETGTAPMLSRRRPHSSLDNHTTTSREKRNGTKATHIGSNPRKRNRIIALDSIPVGFQACSSSKDKVVEEADGTIPSATLLSAISRIQSLYMVRRVGAEMF